MTSEPMSGPPVQADEDTDDLDVAADVDDLDDTEPVELDEDESAPVVADPPAGWGDGLTEADIAERYEGVEVTEGPDEDEGE